MSLATSVNENKLLLPQIEADPAFRSRSRCAVKVERASRAIGRGSWIEGERFVRRSMARVGFRRDTCDIVRTRNRAQGNESVKVRDVAMGSTFWIYDLVNWTVPPRPVRILDRVSGLTTSRGCANPRRASSRGAAIATLRYLIEISEDRIGFPVQPLVTIRM